ncbi:MAG: hypothetical protein CVU38_11125 [Chloroflexi bacterium HGW-Chloroflexi-1]|nr:MAG: hypothetical protein CVU38_11125 [Chloroflexi bacterium HGW-Chloroflexi-1]
MAAVQVQQVIARDGEVLITGLPYKRGQAVEIIVFLQPATPLPRARLTVGRLRRSGLIGLWQDRDDIGDSSVYARHLREQAQQRGDIHSTRDITALSPEYRLSSHTQRAAKRVGRDKDGLTTGCRGRREARDFTEVGRPPAAAEPDAVRRVQARASSNSLLP